MDLGIATVVAITVLAYLAGELVKLTPLNNKWIPVTCGVVGTVLGIIAYLIGMPDMPAQDIITAAAIGAASGLAATGVNQVGQKLISNKDNTSTK